MNKVPSDRRGLPPGWYWASGGPQPNAMADEGMAQCWIAKSGFIRTRGNVPPEVSDAVTARLRGA